MAGGSQPAILAALGNVGHSGTPASAGKRDLEGVSTKFNVIAADMGEARDGTSKRESGVTAVNERVLRLYVPSTSAGGARRAGKHPGHSLVTVTVGASRLRLRRQTCTAQCRYDLRGPRRRPRPSRSRRGFVVATKRGSAETRSASTCRAAEGNRACPSRLVSAFRRLDLRQAGIPFESIVEVGMSAS